MIGAILAGGENRRIPFIKGLLNVNGRPIIERSVRILGDVFGRVVISTNLPERYFYLGLPLIGDCRCERGPMTGVVSTLLATTGEALFVVACDMPFISDGLIRYMAERYERECSREGKEYEAVIPLFRGNREPLFGIYTRSALAILERGIDEGERSLMRTLEGHRVLFVEEEEVRARDPLGDSFVNINTLEDYEKIGGKTCLV